MTTEDTDAMSYDPNSTDSMFSKIMERLDKQDITLERIERQTVKTNGRVTELEQEKWYVRGVTTVLAFLAPGLWEYFKNK